MCLVCLTNYFETICKIYLYFHRLKEKTTRIGRLLDELQTVEGSLLAKYWIEFTIYTTLIILEVLKLQQTLNSNLLQFCFAKVKKALIDADIVQDHGGVIITHFVTKSDFLRMPEAPSTNTRSL